MTSIERESIVDYMQTYPQYLFAVPSIRGILESSTYLTPLVLFGLEAEFLNIFKLFGLSPGATL